MKDVVVDTNVFVHAQERSSPHFLGAARFVAALMGANTDLCLDRDFEFDDSTRPGSLIGAEYLKHLLPQSYGYTALAVMLAAGRFKAVGTKVPQRARQWSDQQIGKKRDRTFFRVAVMSEDKTLVSHDETDFSPRIRRGASKAFSVDICLAETALSRL